MLPWGGGAVRGTIVLDLPVTYQNLLDGVIQFIVSDGRGGTQTLVPEAYTPDNDLYVSGDQGRLDIVNVHPGSDFYTSLELRGNWSGSGKSLMNIIVAGGPRVSGISGIFTWPNVNSVVHEDITDDVVVIVSPSVNNARIDVEDRDGITSSYSIENGLITIPANDVRDAISRRLKFSLNIEGEFYSYIVFLPSSESESFDNIGALSTSGDYVNGVQSAVTTDYIDIQYVKDIAYTGSLVTSQYARLCAYDENQNFVKVLLGNGGSQTPVHFVPDGTYRFIRACSGSSYTKSLMLYYPDRR